MHLKEEENKISLGPKREREKRSKEKRNERSQEHVLS